MSILYETWNHFSAVRNIRTNNQHLREDFLTAIGISLLAPFLAAFIASRATLLFALKNARTVYSKIFIESGFESLVNTQPYITTIPAPISPYSIYSAPTTHT